MTEETQGRQRNHKRLWMALAALVALLAILIVPPLVSVSRYKSRITHLISTSLGRPVRVSSVEVRILPRPGFVLDDLSVEEDPAYGAEPVLHANTVTASIRLLSLWRGRLEIDTISVDEASLNLVRSAPGRWNLDPLLRTASAQAQSAASGAGPRGLIKLPYLEATNSRINIKNGVEKLPFSLLNAKMSLWQQSPGDWRVRLRGQPVRTDLSTEQADTGIVRLEANLHSAPELRQMPVHLDLEWREAQLGQLTRLVLGSDAGWRGDLTGELHLDGTAESAQIKTQLRATGVHRAEFSPASPMDFDANCTFAAHFTTRAIDNLLCDSPLGSGRVRLTGNLPGDVNGQGGLPRFTVELDRIPVAAGLDALRTVRSGLAPGLEASGEAGTPRPSSFRQGTSGGRATAYRQLHHRWPPTHRQRPQRAPPNSQTASGACFCARKPASRRFSGVGGHCGYPRWRSHPAHGFHTPRAFRLSVHDARPGFHRPGQGTGARGRHRSCRGPGRSYRRFSLYGPDGRGSLDGSPDACSDAVGPNASSDICYWRRLASRPD
jgi:hypothetical protein